MCQRCEFPLGMVRWGLILLPIQGTRASVTIRLEQKEPLYLLAICVVGLCCLISKGTACILLVPRTRNSSYSHVLFFIAGIPKFILISVHDYNLPSFLLSSGYFTGKRKAESEVLGKYPNSGNSHT